MEQSRVRKRSQTDGENLDPYTSSTLRRTKSKKRLRKQSTSGIPLFQIITFLWLSFLTYWIFYGMEQYHTRKQDYQTHINPTPIMQHIYVTPEPTEQPIRLTQTQNPIEQIEDEEQEPPIPTLAPIESETTKPRKLPTIYLLRTREGEGLSGFQKYLFNTLDIPDLDIQPLEYQSNEKEFFSSGQMVPALQLQQSITLFVFHLTTPKITGTWDTELHSAIFKKTTGNCVWTSIKGSHPSEIAERPVSPEGIKSGVNLFADSYKLEKVLQFHTSQQDYIDDNHNRINIDKLRKLIKAKEDAINP